jgi:hypothetical protein
VTDSDSLEVENPSENESNSAQEPAGKKLRSSKATVSSVWQQMAAAAGAGSAQASMPVALDKEVELKGIIELEINRYRVLPHIPHTENQLHWWRDHGAVSFPMMAKLARQILAIPATEAASERVFSDGGQVVSDLRWRLDNDNISSLVFLKKNWRLVEDYVYNSASRCVARKQN